MKNKAIVILLLALFFHVDIFAGGISVDAGITPPQDRFIVRMQYRYMSLDNSMVSMNTQMLPLVVAYGVSPGFSVMARGIYVSRKVEQTGNVRNGINDPFLLAKFRLYRINTQDYVFGIAPHIATNIPVGSEEVTNEAWNPELGLNISFRPRFFSIDVSTSYVITDVSEKLNTQTGNIFSINTAVSGLIPLNDYSSNAVSPVLEMTYNRQGQNEFESVDDEILFLSPGISFIHSSLSFEALVQLPVYQSDTLNEEEQNSRLILGLKYMF